MGVCMADARGRRWKSVAAARLLGGLSVLMPDSKPAQSLPRTPGWEGCANDGMPLSQETGEVHSRSTQSHEIGMRCTRGCGKAFIPRVGG